MNLHHKPCATCQRTMSAEDAHRNCQSCRPTQKRTEYFRLWQQQDRAKNGRREKLI